MKRNKLRNLPHMTARRRREVAEHVRAGGDVHIRHVHRDYADRMPSDTFEVLCVPRARRG